MRAVIDHCMKPQIRDHSDGNFRFWADGMTRLAQDTKAFLQVLGSGDGSRTGLGRPRTSSPMRIT
jgi:predicted TIM-barrel fold metal-dependent hydrolase